MQVHVIYEDKFSTNNASTGARESVLLLKAQKDQEKHPHACVLSGPCARDLTV